MNQAVSTRRVLIWDAPVRVVHWLLAGSFLGAYLTAESERWRLVHISLGYAVIALVVFRVIWGVVGTRHARFASFVQGPKAVIAYLKSLMALRPQHHAGHNPAGGWAILALLGLGLLTGLSGWATEQDWVRGEWLAELHEASAELMLLLVGVHVVAVVLSSRLHRENLIGAMWTGRKQAPADQAIRGPQALVAVAVFAMVAGLWCWVAMGGLV